MEEKKGFWALDGIRFFLGAYLLVGHTWHQYPAFHEHLNVFRIFGLGNMATSLFFALSGFLLTQVYVLGKGRGTGRIDRRKFMVARLSTIYPLHLIGLALSLPVIFLTIFKEGGLMVAAGESGDAMRALSSGEIMYALAAFLTLTHAWLLDSNLLIFNVPAWSLSALLFYYLLFPWLSPRLTALRSPMTALVIVGLVFAIPGAVAHVLALTGPVAEGVLHHHPLIRMPLFVGGILLCSLYQRHRANATATLPGGPSRALLWAVVGVTMAVGIHFYIPGGDGGSPLIKNGMYYPAALIMVWLAVTTSVGVSDKLRALLARLGKASLSMFMLHLPLFALTTRAEQLLHSALVTDGGLSNLRGVVKNAADIAPQSELYIVHLLLIGVVSVVVQEKFATPLQLWFRNKLAGAKPAAEQPPGARAKDIAA